MTVTRQGAFRFEVEFGQRPRVRNVATGAGERTRVLVCWDPCDDDLARELFERGTSVVDLSGNLMIVAPGTWYVERLGAPNRFPDTRLVKNAFRGASSLVARALAGGESFRSAKDLLAAIEARGGRTSLPTVSRALRQFEQEAVVVREPEIRIVDCDRFLRLFVAGYAPPAWRRRITGRVADLPAERAKMVGRASEEKARLVGFAPERYVDFSSSYEEIEVYTTSAVAALAGVDLKTDAPFKNLTVYETDDSSVYFDARDEDGLPWAAPLEVYLRLATGDDRMREMAKPLRDDLLRRCGNGR